MARSPKPRPPREAKPAAPVPAPEDLALFHEAVAGATRIRHDRLVVTEKKPPPIPVHSLLDLHETIVDSITGPIPWEESMETGEELVYVKDNVPRETLRKLRRGHWVVQASADLHGMNRDQAHDAVAQFLAECLRKGMRCVRIVHGKGLGSPNREPVLKGKIRGWLMRRSEVLAYSQAPVNLGGGGALLVLLASPRKLRATAKD
jgi:DNA-nicking Smr family endonuclease